jgi:hypothetical protein
MEAIYNGGLDCGLVRLADMNFDINGRTGSGGVPELSAVSG